ncbi:hypothetical protein K470DRAFT_9252 [Piedraia hortae CBS 480.64]|uniref:Uncharacterized protein n=1 Tax=Piedraia hortae CBS 480.64 TaxID=1314780 RepID=A0A6A7C4I7_9PEZI|nr:hypothetical protein K470DRAFT_9252 [Piedraia hortae CBS 480.64]
MPRSPSPFETIPPPQALSRSALSSPAPSPPESQLLSLSLRHKHTYAPNDDTEDVYTCTYGVRMPRASVDLLSPLVAGLTGGASVVNADARVCHTVGLWTVGTSAVYRCCFVQPVLSSSTECIPVAKYFDAEMATHRLCEELGAVACTVVKHNYKVQVSGRLTPYVTDNIETTCGWSFVNVSKSRFVFICTDDDGSHVATMTRESAAMLRSHAPDSIAYVSDVKTSAYKVTARPAAAHCGKEANKNTCMLLYADWSFKSTGKPDAMYVIGAGFRQALLSIASSRSWPLFVKSLVVL